MPMNLERYMKNGPKFPVCRYSSPGFMSVSLELYITGMDAYLKIFSFPPKHFKEMYINISRCVLGVRS